MRASLIPAAVLLLTSTVAQAALTLTYDRKKVGEQGPPGTATMVFDSGRIRMEGMTAHRGAASVMIIDGPGKKMLMLDPEKKIYREMTEADAKQMKERMEAMRAQMPPEMRKRMEERTGGPAAAPQYEKTGAKKKIAGYSCEVYRVKVGDTMMGEACYAPWGSGLASKADADKFQKAMADMEKSFAFMPGMRMTHWSDAPGVPIEQSHYGSDGKTVESITTLKSVSRSAVPASTFEVPAGFTKEPLMGPGGHMGGGMGPGGPHGMGPGGPHGPHGGPGGPPPSP